MNTTNTENKSMDLEDEEDYADLAFQDIRERGYTERRCLRCGGRYRFHDGGSGYRVWCENGDFNMTRRGI